VDLRVNFQQRNRDLVDRLFEEVTNHKNPATYGKYITTKELNAIINPTVQEACQGNVFYVGDGGGDLHPCLLPVVKHRIARRDYALAKLLASRGLEHHTWETPAELAAVFDAIVE
jgi:2-hydroxy-3-keto-5-methylthiopentenyl-1-phosphate phosphatase